jgi:hypothetical protein
LLCFNVAWCLMFFGGNIRKNRWILMEFCDWCFKVIWENYGKFEGKNRRKSRNSKNTLLMGKIYLIAKLYHRIENIKQTPNKNKKQQSKNIEICWIFQWMIFQWGGENVFLGLIYFVRVVKIYWKFFE